MNIKLLTVSVVILFLFSGCGKDGSEGNAYVSFTWSNTLDWYNDSNSSVPSTIYSGREYSTGEGSFSFQYQASSSGTLRVWSGSYNIKRNGGEKGSFPFIDGKNGDDRHYRIYLGWNGASISYKPIKESIEHIAELNLPASNISEYVMPGEIIHQKLSDEKYTVELTCYEVKRRQ